MGFYGSKLLDTKDAIAGGSVTLALPTSEILSGLFLRLYGSLVITGGTGVGTQLTRGVLRLIRNIKVLADGQTLVSIPAFMLDNILTFWMPETYTQTAPANLNAGTTHAIEANALLPLFMPFSKAPDALALHGAAAGKPTLEVEFGNGADIARGEDATSIAFSAMKLDVTAWPLLGNRPAEDVYDSMVFRTYQVPIVASNASQRVSLDQEIPGAELRGIMLVAEDNGAGGQNYSTSETVLRYARVEVNGQEVYGKTSFAVQQQRNKVNYALSAVRPGTMLFDAAENREAGEGDLPRIFPGTAPVVEMDVITGTADTRITIVTCSVLRNPNG